MIFFIYISHCLSLPSGVWASRKQRLRFLHCSVAWLLGLCRAQAGTQQIIEDLAEFMAMVAIVSWQQAWGGATEANPWANEWMLCRFPNLQAGTAPTGNANRSFGRRSRARLGRDEGKGVTRKFPPSCHGLHFILGQFSLPLSWGNIHLL